MGYVVEAVTNVATGGVTFVYGDGPTPGEVLAEKRANMAISRFQARAALMDAGLLADVELAIANADPIVQLAWAEAVEFRRTSSTILAMANAMGLTDEQLDNLFIAASAIVV